MQLKKEGANPSLLSDSMILCASTNIARTDGSMVTISKALKQRITMYDFGLGGNVSVDRVLAILFAESTI